MAAARKRVQRGTLRGYKVDGQWLIVLPVGTESSYESPMTGGIGHGQDAGVVAAKDALIAQLQAENTRLWDLVARLAGDRSDLAELPAGSSPPEPGPAMSVPGSESTLTPRKAPKPSPWWRRWFSRSEP